MASAQTRPGQMIDGINITPLVDVVLVLLIVLMVTASYTVSQSLPMNLPKAASGEKNASPLYVGLDKDGTLTLDGDTVTLSELTVHVRKRSDAPSSLTTLLAADRDVPHGRVVRVIDALRVEGVTQFAINVAPETPTTGESAP